MARWATCAICDISAKRCSRWTRTAAITTAMAPTRKTLTRRTVCCGVPMVSFQTPDATAAISARAGDDRGAPRRYHRARDQRHDPEQRRQHGVVGRDHHVEGDQQRKHEHGEARHDQLRLVPLHRKPVVSVFIRSEGRHSPAEPWTRGVGGNHATPRRPRLAQPSHREYGLSTGGEKRGPPSAPGGTHDDVGIHVHDRPHRDRATEAYLGGLIRDAGKDTLTAVHVPLAMALMGLAVWLPLRARRG